jgi:hypothetical protein
VAASVAALALMYSSCCSSIASSFVATSGALLWNISPWEIYVLQLGNTKLEAGALVWKAAMAAVMSMDWIDFGLDWISWTQSRSG